jgi:23S rRNA (guanosine2251-2'-O)-methyltransferase
MEPKMNIINGKQAIKEALKANIYKIERILVNYNLKDKAEIQEILNLAKTKNIKIQLKNKVELGIQAFINLTPTISLEQLIENKTKYPYVLIVDHIQDPYNFGAILRSCEIFGFNAVIFPKDRNCQITPGVVKASSGAINYLKLVKVTNLSQTLEILKKAGFWLYGADSNQGQDLAEIDPVFPLGLVIGNEKKGLSPLINKKLDFKIHIPMLGKISSLNVSVATGIITYSLSRKRKK